MFPTLVEVGPFALHSYGLMMAVAFLVALYFIQRDGRKAGLNSSVLGDTVFWSLFIGIVGARLFHILLFPSLYSWSDPIGWIAVWRGGLVFQGAIVPVLAFIYIYLRRKKIDFWKAIDIIVPYGALAHGIGRIGCFLNGCCYGKCTSMPWGIPFRRVPWDLSKPATGSAPYLDHLQRFPEMSAQSHWSYPVHPTQLYEFFLLLALCLVLLELRKRWHPFDGFLLSAYFVLYGILRFFLEFYRGDHNPTHVWTLTDQQVFSVVLVAVGVLVYFVRKWWLNRSILGRKTAV